MFYWLTPIDKFFETSNVWFYIEIVIEIIIVFGGFAILMWMFFKSLK